MSGEERGQGTLGALLAARGLSASGAPSVPASAPAAVPAWSITTPPKVVVRLERKGHGGKTVTLLRGDALDDSLRAQLAAELRRALGTHAGVEGDAVVLGGDQRARLQAWLQQRGARRIVVSS